ncbi:MAG: hypothetical protein LBF37_03660 [Rickettsiales bacterium]|jgi:hypothetical protein|nr:hypothetical protein [Rickettsiales bacterium]
MLQTALEPDIPCFLLQLSDITDSSVTGYKVFRGPKKELEYYETRVLSKNVRIREFSGRVNLLNLEICSDIFLDKATEFSALNLLRSADITVPRARHVNLPSLVQANVYAVRAENILVGPKFIGHIFCGVNTKVMSVGNKDVKITRFFTPINAMRYSLRALTR